MTDTPLLQLADVEARYGPVKALHGVSLTVEEGDFAALLGANGAGKTTMLRAVSRFVRRSCWSDKSSRSGRRRTAIGSA